MSDACVGLAGSLQMYLQFTAQGSFSDELSPRAGSAPKALMVIITLNTIVQVQIAS